MTTPSPTRARSGGEHRVLEPPGATPLAATRLDALADLWDGELRLDAEAVVLSTTGHRALTDRLGDDPDRLTAALVETIAERGGLGPEAADAVLVGTIAAVGTGHPLPAAVGERVAVAMSAAAIPAFVPPLPNWDGGRVVPVGGHAILPPAAVTVLVGDVPPVVAALLADVADVPASLAAGERTLVIGIDRPAGVVALAAAAARGRTVTAVVGSLASARLARALGAGATAVVAVSEPVDGADHLVARGVDDVDLVVVADPAGAALAARIGAAVQVLTDPVAAPQVAAEILHHARACGRGPAIHAGRARAVDRGAAVEALLAASDVLSATLRWHAGLGPAPVVRSGDDAEDP